MTKYTIARLKLARSPLATGPGFAWRWLYNVTATGGIIVVRGADTLASAESSIRQHARRHPGPYYIEKTWNVKPRNPTHAD